MRNKNNALNQTINKRQEQTSKHYLRIKILALKIIGPQQIDFHALNHNKISRN